VRFRVALLAVLIGLAALGAALSAEASGGSDAPLPASPHPRQRLAHGLLPAWPQVHDHLVVHKTTVRAGRAIEATLVVSNTGGPVNLTTGCRPSYAVALSSPTHKPTVAFRATCNGRSFIVRSGTTRLHVKIATTYGGCSATNGTAFSTFPVCIREPSGRLAIPPLPPGRYTTVLVGTDLALPQPRSIAITLMPSNG
jgi:hypothetical protein